MTKRILWVDDETDILDVVAVHLRLQGYDFETASCATEAWQRYQAAQDEGQPFRLLVLDIMMRDHSGLWVAKQVRASGDGQTQFLFCTAADSVFNRQEAQEVNAIGFVEKPFDFRRLAELMDAAMAN